MERIDHHRLRHSVQRPRNLGCDGGYTPQFVGEDLQRVICIRSHGCTAATTSLPSRTADRSAAAALTSAAALGCSLCLFWTRTICIAFRKLARDAIHKLETPARGSYMKKVKTGVSKWHVARMRCADCGINVVKAGEYNYMAAAKLWQKATAGSDDIRFLCIGCFEQRCISATYGRRRFTAPWSQH